MRKGRDGEKKNGKKKRGKKKQGKKSGKKKKRRMKIVATTSLPEVDRPNADHWIWKKVKNKVLVLNKSKIFPR